METFDLEKVEFGANGGLFRVAGTSVGVPLVQIDGKPVDDWRSHGAPAPEAHRLKGVFRSISRPDAELSLELVRSLAGHLIRFRWLLKAGGKLTKTGGVEQLRYFSVEAPMSGALTEIGLANFDGNTNIYKPIASSFEPGDRYEGQSWVGPILLHEGSPSWLLAYEHGGDSTIRFLQFRQAGKVIDVEAVTGSYWDGEPAEMESPWFQLALGASKNALMESYRTYMLTEFGPPESRKPHVYYNTWNHQERQKYLHGRPYLESMNLDRILAEIEVAHEMGIDVFVIDTGWFAKTGDWEVSPERFPDGLKTVRERLEHYGMKLGLWFNPIVAAKTSRAYLEHPEWVRQRHDGSADFWGPIWETEESYGMCVCSGWADEFAKTLIRLHRELGVSYFKWDAIGLFGCSSPHHDHGDETVSAKERGDRYGFESGRQLTRIAAKVCQECPDAIVDFDVTESGRYFGLGFLSAGKFFLVNNGPYFHNFDIPDSHHRDPDTINVFFNPGPARPRICRGGFRFDAIVGSILYLTHYLPDGPTLSQENSLASLVLGGNGIWGSLPELSRRDIDFWARGLGAYKRVRDSVTRAYPRVVGEQGSSPEIHEKLLSETGEGVVCFFTVTEGSFEYLTQPIAVSPGEVIGADSWEHRPGGRILLKVSLPRNGARTVFLSQKQV